MAQDHHLYGITLAGHPLRDVKKAAIRPFDKISSLRPPLG
jgi:hypothetical protein